MAEDDDTRAPSARKSPEDRAIGRRLREVRVARGVSQRELAAAVGLTPQALSKIELGDNRLVASRLVEIANALKVPPSEILGKPSEHVQTDPQSARLVRLFKNLSATQKASVISLLYALQPSNDR